MSVLALRHFEAVEDWAVRGALPDGQDHGFTEPALDGKFFNHAKRAMNLHAPLGGLRGEFRGPVFRQVRDQTEQMIAVGIGRAKYWTAEFAAQTAKWGMEVHGALGV